MAEDKKVLDQYYTIIETGKESSGPFKGDEGNEKTDIEKAMQIAMSNHKREEKKNKAPVNARKTDVEAMLLEEIGPDVGKKGLLPDDQGKIRCKKCTRTLSYKEYYTYKDGSHPDLCKRCMTMHVDNFNEESFLWILKDMDVPYVPGEWVSLRNAAFVKNPNKMTGMTVLGKYLAKMRLSQWKSKGWADSEECQIMSNIAQEKKNEEKQREIKQIQGAMERLKENYEAGLISEAEYKTHADTAELYINHMQGVLDQKAEAVDHPEAMLKPPEDPGIGFINDPRGAPAGRSGQVGSPAPFKESYIEDDEMPDYASQLTKEDRIYLAIKWGKEYPPDDWIALEKKYNDMCKSFLIEDADTVGTLKLLCKTDLKMNQAINLGDVDGYQKLARVYESLRKSAKFTAAQNKEDSKQFIDCIGNLVLYCEKEGFIPRFPTDIPQDKVDITLRDMTNYTRKLVVGDLGLGQAIEDAIRKIQQQQEENRRAAEADLLEEQSDMSDLSVEDRIVHMERMEEMARSDEETEKSSI